MEHRLKGLLSNKRKLVILYILLAFAASIQSLSSGTKTSQDDGIEYNINQY